MKSVEDIRRANLKALIDESGSQARLSAISGVPAPVISQVARGVMHSSGKGPRVMGSEIARRLEVAMGKPRGWMDTDHSALNLAADLNGREGQLVGLFRLMGDVEQAELVNALTKKLRSQPLTAPDPLTPRPDSARH